MLRHVKYYEVYVVIGHLKLLCSPIRPLRKPGWKSE
ncbi:hypothetical protein AVEN_156776-1, partial [Araneus ventricosus]